MGTNYYLIREPKPACECCKRPYPEEKLHIGKSSAGWCFSLHVGDDVGSHSLEDWKSKWREPGWQIFDEYGGDVSAETMLKTITERSWSTGAKWSALEYRQNYAEEGPDGLVRYRIDGERCIGHGRGTYDLIAGDFF